MPIMTINTVPLPDSIDKGAIVKEAIQTLADAIETPAERIFAGWNYYQLEADGLNVATSFQSASHPPVVSIDMFTGRSKEKKVKALTDIANLLKQRLDFSGNPFVYIRDIENAHVTTGGQVIDKS